MHLIFKSRNKLIWEARHEWGASKSVKMLRELSGFYLKVERTIFDIFATEILERLPKCLQRNTTFYLNNTSNN
jgi:hypothetical protein